MKINNLFIPGILFLVLAIASCKKDGDKISGPPIISKVTTSLNHGNGITAGALNQWVVIHGKNLSGTQKVVFDDLEVNYEDIYASDTLVSVQIPRRIPAETLNKLTVTTPLGSATYEFQVVYPALKFSRLKNEYQQEGSILDIEGDNFDLYFEKENMKVTFAGGVEATITELNATTIKVIVPAGAEKGPLLIKGGEPLNSEINTVSSWYKDDRNMMIVEPVLVPGPLTESSPDFPDNPAPMLIKAGDYAAGGWDTFFSTYINFPAGAVTNVDGYAMKFEMNTKIPISIGDIIFRLGNNNYYRWPYNYFGTVINTNNQWETISIPLKLIAVDPTDNVYFQFILSDGNSRTLNFATCNFRIVPIN